MNKDILVVAIQPHGFRFLEQFIYSDPLFTLSPTSLNDCRVLIVDTLYTSAPIALIIYAEEKKKALGKRYISDVLRALRIYGIDFFQLLPLPRGAGILTISRTLSVELNPVLEIDKDLEDWMHSVAFMTQQSTSRIVVVTQHVTANTYLVQSAPHVCIHQVGSCKLVLWLDPASCFSVH